MDKVFFNNRHIKLGCEGPGQGREVPLWYYTDRAGLCERLESFSRDEAQEELHIIHPRMQELIHAFRSCFLCLEAAGGIVRNGREDYLAIFRNGMWDLPKGKLETGEGFEEAALREVEEECGLNGLVLERFLGSTFHTYTLHGRKILKETRWFGIRYAGKADPVLQGEEGITDFRWLDAGSSFLGKDNTYSSILDVLTMDGLLQRD